MSEKAQVQGNQNQSLEQFHYKQELKRVLKLPGVCLFGFAYLAPCTIFTTYGLITARTHGMLALSYCVATLAMLFTALSYRQMVKAFPIAGSVYTYVQRAVNPHVGFLSGWAILMDYMLLPMINFLVCGLYLPLLIPALPGWAVTVGLVILSTFIVARGVSITSIVDNICVIIQALFLFAAIICAIRLVFVSPELSVNGTGIFNAAEWPEVGVGGIVGGASVLALSFLGFDSVTTLAEETHNPEKTIGNALVIICLVAGGVFIFASLFFQLAWPNGWFEIQDPDTGSFELLGYVGGTFLSSLFCAIAVFGCGASAIASMTSAARILYGMGRDEVLPKKFFGHVNKKTQAPDYNTYLVGAVSLAVALIVNLETGTSLINFGALLGFALVNISVITYYYGKKKERGGKAVFTYLILPILGACVCLYIWINLDVKSLILGFSWLIVGFIYLAIRTKGFKNLPPTIAGMSE